MKYLFRLLLLVSIILFIYSSYSLIFHKEKAEAYEKAEESLLIGKAGETEKQNRIEKIEINDGETYGVLMDRAGVDYVTQTKIYNAALASYDLVKIRVGKTLNLIHDKNSDEFIELVYQIDTEEELHVRKIKSENGVATSSPELETWQAEVVPINYEIRIKTSGGTVESSMYQAALDNSIDERAIIELANAFQWEIDFAMDPRKGDTFKFVYEERYLNGEYVMPGKVLAGQYVNEGENHELYYFEETKDNIGYFDAEGNSAQKMFLKAPVEFRYISSGYTTGNRVVMEIGLSGQHRAVDYAAAMGTPIRAVGDGKVTSAGWSRVGYGNLISIRHNGTYSTNYAHLSKFAVKSGQSVKQGEVIGYVGSTGYSTGPHLHYEMVKNGTKIDPLKEVLPPGKAIAEENRARFLEEKKKLEVLLEK
ncbi:MAG: M23 family metallopeptidase [Candidatus Magasanikbacteria bacterium]|nr:M23 family metallopeptidase [Candidatus Magasanikbacteria bacterium]